MRANNSGGPLAKGLSIPLFSHGIGPSCRIGSYFSMPSDTFEQLLGRACALNGIDPGFWDIWGKYHETTLAAKQAILRAKGFDAADAASLKQSLAAHDLAEWERILPPALVVGEAEPIELPVSVRAD